MAGGTRSKGRGRTTPARTTRSGAEARHRTEARRAAQQRRPGARRSRTTMIAAVVLLVVLVAGIVGALAFARDDGDDPAAEDATPPVTAALTGTVVAEQGEILPISTVPATYEVSYRVESASGGDSIVRTEDISVRRPFDARLVAFADGGSFDNPEVDARSNLGLYADVTDPEDPDVGEGMPAAALGDLRLDGSLFDLVEAGVFVPRERREVLGRECQVYRTGSLVESPPLAVPTAGSYADVCIDAAGLVLEQVAITEGIPETYEIATSVKVDPVFDDDRFAISGEPISLEEGGNDLIPLDMAVPPVAPYWVPASAPLGATHIGRYMLRTPNPQAAGGGETSTTVGPSEPTDRWIDTYLDVYATGSTFVIVHQGEVSEATTRDTTLGTDVDAGALGPARVAFGATGSTLVATNGTWFVEVSAPLSADELAAIATTLSPGAAPG